MPATSNYSLEFFPRGTYYSSSADYRRFVTVDYNLKTYYGLVGVGIISGWVINHTSGLEVEIIPGNGVIDGYYVESPYTIIKRSQMIMGNREIEVQQSDISEPYLTTLQKTTYVSIIQAYDPTYIPDSQIEDAYVKVSTPYKMTLSDNSDNYVYVVRKSTTPYPKVSDFPNPTMYEPQLNTYPNYTAYSVDKALYDAQIAAVKAYNWDSSTYNHFTEVSFKNSIGSFVGGVSQVLLGKVITRNGIVTKINTDNVFSLYKMQSMIQAYANTIVPKHKHGGNSSYDPAFINLETDIRDTVLVTYDDKNQIATFRAVEKKPTSIEIGHKHTYYIDSTGNGLTVGKIGSGLNHFHKISSFIVGTPEYTVDVVESHIHTIDSIYDGSWTTSSDFEVYINKNVIGDQSSSNIKVDVTSKTIAMNGIIGGIYKTFSSTFQIYGTTYSYTAQMTSVYRFMLAMMSDFDKKFASQLTNTSQYDEHPFIFINEDGSIAGLNDLKEQCLVAESFIKNEGDYFVFTPQAAKNIKITLVSYKKVEGLDSDTVQIEIFGNSEITGKLKTENIIYINAEKITTGEFEVVRLPFISHAGRINEKFNVYQNSMLSNDGIQYTVTPSITTENASIQNHFHTMELDKENTGTTIQVYIGSTPVYYATNTDGSLFLINHTHSVIKGVISSSSTDTVAEHTHEVIDLVRGDSKTIYSMFEDQYGNIYSGTSDGLIMIPVDNAYIFVINGYTYYEISSTLNDALVKAQSDYENEVSKTLVLNPSVYDTQIIKADENLNSDGDTYIISGKSSPTSDLDVIMIKKIDSFSIPYFKYVADRDIYNVGNDEIPIQIKVIDKISGQELDITNKEVLAAIALDPTSVKIIYAVERYLDDTPVWDMSIKSVTRDGKTYNDITTIGANTIGINSNLQDSFYNSWISPLMPIYAGVYKRLLRDSSNNLWITTNQGLMISRSYNNQQIFESTTLSDNVDDVIEGEYGVIYAAYNDGVYKTVDIGKTWTNVLSTGSKVTRLLRDFISDTTDNLMGHTHKFIVNRDGVGVTTEDSGHYHSVNNWVIGTSLAHTHTFIVTIYAITEIKTFYSSNDNGVTWTKLTNLPSGEYSDIFVFNENIFIGKSDGLYKLEDNKWMNIFSKTIYSFCLSYDMSTFYLGSCNHIYNYDSSSITTYYQFGGLPQNILYVNGEKKFFNFSYSNSSMSYFFKNTVLSGSNTSAMINFDRWFSEKGIWDENKPYNIYLDNYLLYSIKDGAVVNNGSSIINGSFTIYPQLGEINFGASTSANQNVDINSSYCSVSDTSKFSVGDKILIISKKSTGTEPIAPTTSDVISLAKYVAEMNSYNDEKLAIENMFYFATISSIVTNESLNFTSNCQTFIEMPIKVYKIPFLDGNSNITASIFESMLSNSGINTHEEIEDKFSNTSDFRPYQFNNSYLSNILQLTQAIRFVYPEINQKFIQSEFYDFKYSNNPSDDNYIERFIDTFYSDIFSQSVYATQFVNKEGKNINSIFVGTGLFSGNIFVGTDIGLFWSRIDSGLEANWFYIFDIPFAVYDFKVFGNNKLLVATSDGIYVTEDMILWEKQTSSTITFPTFSISYRWPDSEYITTVPHTCEIYNDHTTKLGTIKASSNIYSKFLPNKSIKIDIQSDTTNTKNGFYIVQNVTPNTITITSAFSGDSETVTDVVIQNASWWQKFSGEVNQGNSDLTNTLIVGGANHISINPNSTSFVWNGSEIPYYINDFNVVNISPMSNGLVIASAPSNNVSSFTNYILSCINLGTSWQVLKSLNSVNGSVNSSYVTAFDHTSLTVTYNVKTYTDSEFDKRFISFYKKGELTPFVTSYVIGNTLTSIIRNNKKEIINTLFVYGRGVYESLKNENNITFLISPIKTNISCETDKNRVLFGTDIGIYYDIDTLIYNKVVEGNVWDSGVSGNVSQIDLPGKIKYINSITTDIKRVYLSVSININVVKDELIGQSLYMVDLPDFPSYKILSNSVKSSTGEINIELEQEFSLIWISYIGKNVVVVDKKSKIYFNMKRVILTDEFKNGTLYVTSNENNNTGKTYTIDSNTGSYAVLSTQIIPKQINLSDTDNNLINGQNISLVGAEGAELVVTFNREVKNNEFYGFGADLFDDAFVIIAKNVPVYQNSNNKIIVGNASEFMGKIARVSSFRLNGMSFMPLPSFDNKKTTNENDHTHNTNMVGKIVSGTIDSFIDIESSVVTIIVSDTSGFTDPLVQQEGNLFLGALIRFYNPYNLSQEYFAEVSSHNLTSITVSILPSTQWDYNNYSDIKVSKYWKWQIDATNYGYTSGIFYNDFSVITQSLSNNTLSNQYNIFVSDTSQMIAGDKVQVNSGNFNEINYIDTIVSLTEIKLTSPTKNGYVVSDSSYIKVLRDYFTNTHEHQIRNNMVETLSINDYIIRGYALSHSHRSVALVNNVSSINKGTYTVTVGGSGSFLYKTNNNGENWSESVDLNQYLESGSEVTGVSTLSVYNNGIIAGTTNGNIFVEKLQGDVFVPLIQPKIV